MLTLPIDKFSKKIVVILQRNQETTTSKSKDNGSTCKTRSLFGTESSRPS